MYVHQHLHSRDKGSEELELVYLYMPGSSREANLSLKIGEEGLDAADLQLG